MHCIGGRPLSTFIRLSEENEKVQNDCRIFAESELQQVAAENDKLARSGFLELKHQFSHIHCSIFLSSN